MRQRVSKYRVSKYLGTCLYKASIAGFMLSAAVSVQAIPTVNNIDESNPLAPATGQEVAVNAQPTSRSALNINGTLAAQLKPSSQALSDANQQLLSRNAQLQRQVNDLQTQANVLVYESKGQLFLYGAFTVLISLLVGIFISWLVFVRRDRW